MWTPHCVTKYNLEEKKKKKPSFSNQTLIYVFLVLKKNVLYLNMMWNTLFCIRNTLNTVFLAHFLKTVFWLFWKQKHQSLLIWDMRAFLIWISHYCFLCNMEVDVILPLSLTTTYYHLGIFWRTLNVHGEQNQDISGGSPMTVKLFGRKQ